MTPFDKLVKRSLTEHDAERVTQALRKLNSSLDIEFDGVLKQYDSSGNFVGLYWMNTEAEEWMFDPQGDENGIDL